ncbi:TULIP family P47-like protein [Sphingomonas abietis]|uniref:TULIP family P47-like protein n=1 Tax=Sphingomonas abietis TaxID=3012344 RepID=A0ABY7NIS4_9SPHN|nr:TULIP family P47-like protein [Sphingomonas abietis]WBO21379.1 TULIP family P47-like protein [Sphingomonas abietis]
MDTHGWDVISASNIATVNSVLSRSMTALLATFDFSNTAMDITLSGQFDPWTIQPGGSANRIKLMMPIAHGTLTAPPFRQPIDLAGVQPVLNLELAIVQGASAGSQSVAFSLHTNSPTPTDDGGAVYVANPDASGLLNQRDPTKQAAAIINDWFGEILVQNSAKISFVFATIVTNPQGQPWLAPKATSVSYFESVDGQTQALAIQSLTQAPWGPDILATAVDPSLLAAGDAYFFAMAPAVFLRNLLMPNVASALHVPASALQFNPPSAPNQPLSCSITNTQSISMGSVRSGAIDYYPELTSYAVAISGSQILTSASGQFDISGLHDAYVTFDNLNVVMDVGYDQATRSATFTVVSRSSPSTDEHIPWYEKELTWIVPVVGLVVNIVMDAVVAAIENAVTDSLTSSGQLSIGAIPVASAVWTGLSQFNTTDAELADAFVIRASGAS